MNPISFFYFAAEVDLPPVPMPETILKLPNIVVTTLEKVAAPAIGIVVLALTLVYFVVDEHGADAAMLPACAF